MLKSVMVELAMLITLVVIIWSTSLVVSRHYQQGTKLMAAHKVYTAHNSVKTKPWLQCKHSQVAKHRQGTSRSWMDMPMPKEE